MFAQLSTELRASESQRRRTVKHLLRLVIAGDTVQAGLAVDALRFSGLALDPSACTGLVEAAERLYPADVLARLAARESVRQCKQKAKESSQIRLLKSLVMAMLRNGGARETAFVRLVETKFQGTVLAARISTWRAPME